MTLVIGHITEDIGFLVSDTLLTFKSHYKDRTHLINGESHVLKIQILNPDTAIAFAGNDTKASLTLINSLHAELIADSEINLCNRLFELYENFLTNVSASFNSDFLVLQLTPREKTLAKITKTGIFPCVRAYIGDSNEYRNMMSLRIPYIPPQMQSVQQPDGTFRAQALVENAGAIEFAEISAAMEKLTHQRQSSSVGAICGHIIRVVNARISGKLEYLQSARASISQEEGISGFRVLASNSHIRGMGFYYPSGKMGFLFIIGDSEYGRKEYAKTAEEFIEKAKALYGLNLE